MDLQEVISSLIKQDGHYHITEKYRKPEYYHIDDTCDKKIGVYVDVETTGFDHIRDKIIELGLVCFEYGEDGRIFSIIDEYNSFEDPEMQIPQEIIELTGITDDMVRGQKIDVEKVNEYTKKADLIIAHNASFDRKFIEKRIPDLQRKPWACSFKDINWRKEGIKTGKLDYLAFKCGFVYDEHRAISDCLAGVHILASTLPKSGKYVMQNLLENCSKYFIKLYAVRAPFECKDILKSRGYKWLHCKEANILAWSKELSQDLVERELEYLRNEIYQSNVSLPFDIIDGYSRFSNNEVDMGNENHRELREWIRSL